MKPVTLTVLTAIALNCLDLRADVANVSPAQDTGLFDLNPLNNFGAAPNVVVGATASGRVGRMLLEFDVAGAIPAGATINSVTLRLADVSSQGDTYVSSTFSLHRALVDWNGGTNVGNTATAGSATWDYRVFETINWGASGGLSGVDYLASASAGISLSQLVSTNGPGTNFRGSTPQLVTDVQDWLNNPGTNFGWFLVSSAELSPRSARRLGTTENSAAGSRPLLTIDFTPVPEPTTLSLALGGILGVLWLRRRPRA
jgi:hypothetical protein